MKPFYRADGTLLVEDLQADHAVVEAILDGTWRPTFWAQQFMPWDLFRRYPQLKDELRRRRRASTAVEGKQPQGSASEIP